MANKMIGQLATCLLASLALATWAQPTGGHSHHQTVSWADRSLDQTMARSVKELDPRPTKVEGPNQASDEHPAKTVRQGAKAKPQGPPSARKSAQSRPQVPDGSGGRSQAATVKSEPTAADSNPLGSLSAPINQPASDRGLGSKAIIKLIVEICGGYMFGSFSQDDVLSR